MPLKVGGGSIKPSFCVTKDLQYDVWYYNMLNGIIAYHFKKHQPLPDTNAVAAKRKEKQEKEEKKTELERQEENWDDDIAASKSIPEKILLVLAAAAVAGGTTVEDFLSLGIGAADDPIAYAFALKLLEEAAH